jgi:hypothetical protein
LFYYYEEYIENFRFYYHQAIIFNDYNLDIFIFIVFHNYFIFTNYLNLMVIFIFEFVLVIIISKFIFLGKGISLILKFVYNHSLLHFFYFLIPLFYISNLNNNFLLIIYDL